MLKRPIPLSILMAALLLSAARAARLGDLPDEKTKAETIKKNQQQEPEAYTPEEKKHLAMELSDNLYQKALAALRQGRLLEAKELFEKVLALSPNNSRAQTHLTSINKKLSEPKKPAVPLHAVAPVLPEEKRKPLKKSPPKPLSAEEEERNAEAARRKSDNLYLQALAAIQNKEKAEALALCRRALALNPENLQAQRMEARLSR